MFMAITTFFYNIMLCNIRRTLSEKSTLHFLTMSVLALDYLVGVYPLFLIFLTCIAVFLHDRYSIMVKIWKPVYKMLSCIRREWNIRGSLIQAFATFLILSYVKILNVSFDLLLPICLKDVKGDILNIIYLWNINIFYFSFRIGCN